MTMPVLGTGTFRKEKLLQEGDLRRAWKKGENSGRCIHQPELFEDYMPGIGIDSCTSIVHAAFQPKWG